MKLYGTWCCVQMLAVYSSCKLKWFKFLTKTNWLQTKHGVSTLALGNFEVWQFSPI